MLINLSILILNSTTLYVPLKERNILNKPPPLMNSKLRKAVFKKRMITHDIPNTMLV